MSTRRHRAAQNSGPCSRCDNARESPRHQPVSGLAGRTSCRALRRKPGMPHPGALILAESIGAKVRFPPVIRRACDLRVGFRRPYWSASWRSMCGCIGNCILARAPIRPNSAWSHLSIPKGALQCSGGVLLSSTRTGPSSERERQRYFTDNTRAANPHSGFQGV
jgi:hypothetical protein